jgi:chitinase
VFASSTSIQNFITSVTQQVNRYQLDGIDLDIEMYNAAPTTVARMINQLRTELNRLGQKLIIVSPEDVAVYQGSAVPDPTKGGQPFNYFVPIIQ